MSARSDLRAMARPIARPLRRAVRSARRTVVSRTVGSRPTSVSEYWTENNVTRHHRFGSVEESLAYLRWRNSIYDGYADLLPCSGQDGKVVLDYGCGPGHDLVGFATESSPARLIGMDVSPTSLDEARDRLALHGAPVELILGTDAGGIPLPDASVDHVHSSGVLHHLADPESALAELARVLRPGGTGGFMIYNDDSVFLHLYVAYSIQIGEGRYTELPVRDAFTRLTDGEDCPISHTWRPDDFVALVEGAGLECRFSGAAISMLELSQLPRRFDAIADRNLAEEHRAFLLSLELDARGIPHLPSGAVAGVDGCFAVRKPG